MINIIRSKDRHFNDFGWLQTFWLFSFSSYYDPNNLNHGALMVFNDDIVEAGKGFETHPHEEMEIVSIVLSGEMTHKDTMGNENVIRENDVQRMTAGTGLYHSEKNISNEPVHFYQIWIRPDKKGLAPSYDQKAFNTVSFNDRLVLLASDKVQQGVVSLNTDAAIYRSNLRKGKTINHKLSKERNTFIYVIKGIMNINEQKLYKNDQARISTEQFLTINAEDQSEFILVDVPA